MFIPIHDANSLERIRLHYVTLAIIAANIIIWLMMVTPAVIGPDGAQAVMISYGFIPTVANYGAELPVDLLRIPAELSYVSYAFLHTDFMHLAGNMLFIWVFGDNVEDAMGHMKYLLFYVACAAAAALLHGFAFPQSNGPLVGASGAAAGIVAAYLMLHPRVKLWVLAFGRIPLRIPAYWAIGAWIAYQIFMFLFSVGDDVSWAAHVGGIVAGALLVLVLKHRDIPLFDRAVAPISKKVDPAPRWGR